MIEYEDWGSARIAQLEQQDLERYQRDISRNSTYSYDDQTPNYGDEFQSKLSELLDMVQQLSSDIKRTTSSIENRSALPTMNPQPLSFVDDDASCNYSELESETTDEQLSDDESVVNVLPDYAEMMNFDGIQGIDSSNPEMVTDLEEYKVSESSINSHSSVNSSPHKQLTHIDSGFKVLSIYCAHMATKWRHVLDSQPIQGNEMSVAVYYDQFYNWKKQFEAVSYIGDEQSYIDDFLWGLKRDLRMRVWGYKWNPQTLFGAFHRALIEENMMKNDAPMVFDKNAEQDEENDCVVLGKMAAQVDAHMVLVEMSRPVLEDLLGIGITEAAYNLLYERLVPSPVNLDEDLYGNYVIARDLNYEDVVLGDSVANLPLLSLQEFSPRVFDPGTSIIGGNLEDVDMLNMSFPSLCMNKVSPMLFQVVSIYLNGDLCFRGDDTNVVPSISSSKIMFGNTAVFMFDPGISPLHLSGRVPLNSSEMPSSSAVVLWFAKALFSFNLGGCCLFCNGCESFEFYGDQGECWDEKNCIVVDFPCNLATNKGFNSMLDTKKLQDSETVPKGNNVLRGVCGTTCTHAIFIFPKAVIHMLDKVGDWQTYVSSLFCSSQNKGSGIGHLSFNEMFGSFPIKHEICDGPYRDVRLSFDLLKYLGYEGISMLVFYPCIWNPGRSVTPFNILEDKDNFKRVGKELLAIVRMRSRDSQTDGKLGLNVACKPRWQLLFLVVFSSHGHVLWCSLHASKTVEVLATKMVIHQTSGVLFLFSKIRAMDLIKLSVPLMIKLGHTSFFEAHRHDNEAGCRQDCKIKPMLWLVGYKGSSYGLCSCTILVLENSCYVNFNPTINVAYTNEVQGAKIGVGQNDATLEMWLQQRNEVFGIFGLGLGAHMQTMSSAKAVYHQFKTSMVLVYLNGFVWDPGINFIVNFVLCKTEPHAAFGKYFDTIPSFVSKAARSGALRLELRGVLVIVLCVQWYNCLVHGRRCIPHNIEPAQNSFPSLQICMTVKRNMLQVLIMWSTSICSKHVKSYKVPLSNKGVMFSFGFYVLCYSSKTSCDRQYLGFWFGDKFPYECPTPTLVVALFHVSCGPYFLGSAMPKMQGQTTDAIVLPFSIIIDTSKSILCALLLCPYALANWQFGKCNEGE